MIRRLSHICMLSIILLPGCIGSKQKYSIKPLEPLAHQESLIYKDSQENITVHVKKLSDTECVDLFGGRAIRLVRGKNPLVPVQISIGNNTESTCILNAKNIRLSVIPSKRVMGRLQNSSLKTALTALGISLGVAAVTGVVGGLALNACYTASSYPLLGIAGATAVTTATLLVLGTPFFMIKASAPTRTENKRIKKYLKRQGLGDSLIVEAGQTTDALFFVYKKDWKPSFMFSIEKIIDMKTKEHEDIWFNASFPDHCTQ